MKTRLHNKTKTIRQNSRTMFGVNACLHYPAFSRGVFPIPAGTGQVLPGKSSIPVSPASPPSAPLSVHPRLTVAGLRHAVAHLILALHYSNTTGPIKKPGLALAARSAQKRANDNVTVNEMSPKRDVIRCYYPDTSIIVNISNWFVVTAERSSRKVNKASVCMLSAGTLVSKLQVTR